MAVADSNSRRSAEFAQQLALPVQLPVHASFKTFIGTQNEAAVGTCCSGIRVNGVPTNSLRC